MTLTKAGLLSEVRRLKKRVLVLERAADARLRFEETLRQLVDDCPVLIWTTDSDLRLTSLSGALADEVEPNRDDVDGMTLQEYFDTTEPEFPPIVAGTRALAGESLRYSLPWRDKFFLVHTGPLCDARGRVTGSIAIASDTTAAHESESRLAESESRYRDLLNTVHEIVLWFEFGGRILLVNSAAEKVLGYTAAALRGRDVLELVAAESQDAIAQGSAASMDGDTPAFEAVLLAEDGRRVLVEITMRALLNQTGDSYCVQAVAKDVTERRKVDEQIRQAQKMQSIGVLAGGVAHDFNNLLTGILGHAYLLREESGIAPRHLETLDVIVRSAERAAQLTKQLVGLARRGKSENAPCDLHAIVREVMNLLQRTIDKRVRMTASLRATQPYVFGDSTQLYQLLLKRRGHSHPDAELGLGRSAVGARQRHRHPGSHPGAYFRAVFYHAGAEQGDRHGARDGQRNRKKPWRNDSRGHGTGRRQHFQRSASGVRSDGGDGARAGQAVRRPRAHSGYRR
jgi:PAS domain S-box-containing protein